MSFSGQRTGNPPVFRGQSMYHTTGSALGKELIIEANTRKRIKMLGEQDLRTQKTLSSPSSHYLPLPFHNIFQQES